MYTYNDLKLAVKQPNNAIDTSKLISPKAYKLINNTGKFIKECYGQGSD